MPPNLPNPPGQGPGFVNFQQFNDKAKYLSARLTTLQTTVRDNFSKEVNLLDAWDPLLKVTREAQRDIQAATHVEKSHRNLKDRYEEKLKETEPLYQSLEKIISHESNGVLEKLFEQAFTIICKYKGSLDLIRELDPHVKKLLFNHEYDTLHAEFTSYKNHHDSSELAKANDEIIKLQESAKRELDDYKEKSGQELQQVKDKLVNLQSDSSRDLKKVNDNLVDLQNKYDRDIKKAKDDLDDAKGKYDRDLNCAKDDLAHSKGQFERDLQYANDDIAKLQKHKEMINSELQQAKDTLEKSQESAKSLQQRKEDVELQLKSLMENNSTLQREKEEIDSRFQTALNDLKSSKEENVTLRDQNDILQESANQLLPCKVKLIKEKFLRVLLAKSSMYYANKFMASVEDCLSLQNRSDGLEENITTLEKTVELLEDSNRDVILENVYHSRTIETLEEEIQHHVKDINDLTGLLKSKDLVIQKLNGEIDDTHAYEDTLLHNHQMELNDLWESMETDGQYIRGLLDDSQNHEKDLIDLGDFKDQEIGKLQGQLNDAHVSEYTIVREHQFELNELWESTEANFQQMRGIKDTQINHLKTEINQLKVSSNTLLCESKEENATLLNDLTNVRQASNEKISNLESELLAIQDSSESKILALEGFNSIIEENLSNTKSILIKTLSLSWLPTTIAEDMDTWNELVLIMTNQNTITPLVLYGPKPFISRWKVAVRSNSSQIQPGWFHDMKMSNFITASLLYVIIKGDKCMEHHWLTLFLIDQLSRSMSTNVDTIIPIIIFHALEEFDHSFTKHPFSSSMKYASIALALAQLWKITKDIFFHSSWSEISLPKSLLEFEIKIILDLHQLMQVDIDLKEKDLEAVFPSSNENFLNLSKNVGIFAIPNSQWYILLLKKTKVIFFFDKVLLVKDDERISTSGYKIHGPQKFKDYLFTADSPSKRKWFRKFVDASHHDFLSSDAKDMLAKLECGEFVW
ncbi:uncharacterized protein EAE98_012248 [Botrytis deweyae]|uniref:Uncharacterized protein n=1 Tax=Botrytis deweyae TaxID=2478750 RepID=A0ABQ7I3V0_9HELO|nr:uncharacterized protein EAE98_012248 [Botrytis deweyae]KAF7910105.1 hypothetical protein EAE98_012248 [Botrytis deweyae]